MKTRHWILAALTVAVLLGYAWWQRDAAAQPPGSRTGGAVDSQLRELERRIEGTILETGTLQPTDMQTIVAPVTSTVLHIIPEGTSVKAGDLLLQLDDSELQQQLRPAEIELSKSRAGLEVAQRTSSVLGEQRRLAEKLYAKRRETLALKLKAVKEELATGNVSESVRAAETSAIELDQMEAEFEQLRTMLELENESIEAAAQAKQLQLEAELAERTVGRLQKQIKECRVVADTDGIVMYASQSTRRAEPTVMEAGAAVRERQPILGVFQPGKVQLVVRVHETRIADVRVGQNATIRFDAFPNRLFRGAVSNVASTPEPGVWPNTDIKEYSVIVRFVDEPESLTQLRAGLTAVAEIDVR